MLLHVSFINIRLLLARFKRAKTYVFCALIYDFRVENGLLSLRKRPTFAP